MTNRHRVRRLIEDADAQQRENTTDDAREAGLVLMPVEAWDAIVEWARGSIGPADCP